ncbi:MAG TPA: tyrosine-type recombinase/integrase [Pseudonocardiaceae bacterium]|nr:tyrosine-type recombinase/integrase [Pseudonocardiaceae bacterium]
MTELVPTSPAASEDRGEWARTRHAEGWTFDQIGAGLGVTRERVRQLVRSPAVPVPAADTVLPGTAERIASGVPANTSRAYAGVRRQFEAWCTSNGRVPYPTAAGTLADYTAHLADLGRATNTIKHHRGAISALNQAEGFPPLSKEVTLPSRLVQRGHQRDLVDAGRREKKAPPITRDRLQLMSAACSDPPTLAGKRDRLLLVIGWALAGRRSELAALRIEDVTVQDRYLDVLIRTSKTDKDAHGELVPVPAGEHVDTDPVGLLHDYLAALAERGVTSGYLFRSVTQNDTLYRYPKISGHAINEIVKRAAREAGLARWWEYSAHGLRAGFATQAESDGVPMPLWAGHGRWNPQSPVPAGYVRAADRIRDNPLKHMKM